MAPLRILFATEYLPPFISGIANRCKNWIAGYREQGHIVTVYSINGSDCDHVVSSLPNPFYKEQRTFILPPLNLLFQLLDPTKPVEYDIAHLVGPLCLAFIPLMPLMWLRGIKIYISYHVYLEFYRDYYIGSGTTLQSRIFNKICDLAFPLLYYLPLTAFADCVGIPSKVADFYVFEYSRRVHLLKSGLDTSTFNPDAIKNTTSTTIHGVTSDGITTSTSINGVTSDGINDLRALASTKGPLLIFCGRLALEKNVAFLIKAMAHPQLQNSSLVIVGDGPLRHELELLAIEVVGVHAVYSHNTQNVENNNMIYYGDTEHLFHSSDLQMSDLQASDLQMSDLQDRKEKRIVFTGMVLDERIVASYYAQSDLFVSASESETFGFTVAEAMSCGTPAVIVRSGAFPSVYKMIEEHMFDCGDFEGFAGRCEYVYRKNDARSDARSIAVEGFSIQASVQDLLSTYQWIIDGCNDNGKRIE